MLKPRGVGVLVKATHHCMTARGVHKPEADLVTSRMIGCLRDHPERVGHNRPEGKTYGVVPNRTRWTSDRQKAMGTATGV